MVGWLVDHLDATQILTRVFVVVIVEIKTTVVCPATENHVKKYRRQETFLVEEREDDYGSITLPYVEKLCLSVQVRSLSIHRTSFILLCLCVCLCD